MGLPRVRYKLHFLIVAVAVIAAILAVESNRRRLVGLYTQKATDHDKDALYYRANYESALTKAIIEGKEGDRESLRSQADQYRHLVDYYTELAAKYRVAASRPWETVPPDPPVPPRP
jgi:hypothetical protein